MLTLKLALFHKPIGNVAKRFRRRLGLRNFIVQILQYLIYSVSQKKIPPCGLVAIFPKWLGIFQPNFMCLCIPTYARLRIKKIYSITCKSAILTKLCQSVTTQFTSCAQNVHHQPKRTLAFSDIFAKLLGIFSPNFTRLLNVHMYARMQFFIQLSATVTKLCHNKRDHHNVLKMSELEIIE